ncbi:PIN domain-containing protein [Candidatus Bathycorpusculum sp.]|uniref:type II toxin-antitoxin system VapC family toxin n=1 Tax=Candidatus Bathycorpusculum sp. TaxID=2994959 RepID=UPI0028208EA1|nr:type II toxin-antitoxin system VapC family toxin [Candidatus Termitimicrobium sp.]MCL2685580.1 type II toxin-antitoxin system VapC family toxin [Candidatus Termitimicrobium sp.]
METTRYYVDVNIFVYWLSNHPVYGETAYSWIQKIIASSPREYVTSSLTIYEALYVLAGLAGKNLKNRPFVAQITTALTQLKGLTIEPLKPEDLTTATELMDSNKLDYEDALHLAVAIRTGAKEIITDDKDFNITSIKKVF